MIPLRDVVPSRRTPWITWAILAFNVLVYFATPTPGTRAYDAFIREYGLTPVFFSWGSLLTSMFVHGGLAHLLGNMLFLWIFGDNVEDRLGHVRYLLFYLACGAAAALAQTMLYSASQIPMVGASGAISGVLGAYLIMYPHARVLTLVPLFIFFEIIELPAVVFLGLWFLFQLLLGLGTLAVVGTQEVGGVAFWAHAGGFLAGVLGAAVFGRTSSADSGLRSAE